MLEIIFLKYYCYFFRKTSHLSQHYYQNRRINVSTAIAFELNELNLKKLAKNLRMLLDEFCVTESQIAQSLNIPVMTIRRLVSGETTDPRISTLKLIADYFNVSVDTLIQDNNIKTITMGKNLPRFVPLFDWQTIVNVKSIVEIDLTSWKDWHPIILGNNLSLSAEAFAIDSRPSMQPRFPLGTIFIIDPNETPNDGDIVLVKMTRDGELSLRELIIDSPRWQLQPIIAGSDTLYYDSNQHHVMGIVVLTFLHTRKK